MQGGPGQSGQLPEAPEAQPLQCLQQIGSSRSAATGRSRTTVCVSVGRRPPAPNLAQAQASANRPAAASR